MRPLREILNNPRFNCIKTGEDGGCGYLVHTLYTATIIFSTGDDWDHVSVSHKHRPPTWDVMCEVKKIFWADDECVVQYHPKKSEYINNHPNCLHLWKPQNVNFPTPPKIFVGI
ncbi:MAG: hypothetical protein FWG65_11100 [Turicibacter sp.]|nr:hypothetical protein [Turicibacter sp.]